MNGSCDSVKMIDKGIIPKTLNCTQKSVEVDRHIISFNIAKDVKNSAQRNDRVSQAASLILSCSPNKYDRKVFLVK